MVAVREAVSVAVVLISLQGWCVERECVSGVMKVFARLLACPLQATVHLGTSSLIRVVCECISVCTGLVCCGLITLSVIRG